MRGPRGTGCLWVSAPLIDRFSPPGIDATSTDWTSAGLRTRSGIGRFVEYEASYAGLVGLAAAAQQAVATGMEAVEERVVALAEGLRSMLSSIETVTVHDTAERRSGIVTFSVAGLEPRAVVDAAAAAGVRINEVTSTWAALDMEAKGLRSVVRASPHYFNTEAELALLGEVVDGCVGR